MPWIVASMKWIMLVYGALTCTMLYAAIAPQAVRPLVLIVAGISKIAFITLILSVGRQFLGHQAGIAVVSDVIQVSLFLAYLLASAKNGKASDRREQMRE